MNLPLRVCLFGQGNSRQNGKPVSLLYLISTGLPVVQQGDG